MKHSKRSDARFVMLPHWMLKSPAWRVLSPTGKAVLLHLWKRHNGTNNGQIVYRCRDAEPIGVSSSTVARALK